MPTPDEYQAAWEEMVDSAEVMLKVADMEFSIETPADDSVEMGLLRSGIAMGVAAATAYFRQNPHMVPPL